MKAIKIKQHDIKDCGAACLASIGNHYGVHMPIAHIRQLASTDLHGTNVLGLVQAAEKMGFLAKGVRGRMESLAQVPLPCIVHLVLKNQLHHFVVLYKVTQKHVFVMDPAFGEMQKYELRDFEAIWSGVLVLLAPGEGFKPLDATKSLLKRFWGLMWPHRSVIFQALSGAVLFTLLGLCMSVYIQKITDYVLIDGNQNLLNVMSVGMLLVIALQAYVGSRKSILMMKSGQLMDAALILGYYKHLMYLPQRFFDTMQIGEITSRISDAIKIRNFLNETVIEWVVNVCVVLFAFGFMFLQDWHLATVMLAFLPLYAFIYGLVDRLNKQVERVVMEDSAALESQLVESLNQIRTVKEFGIQEFMNQKTEHRFVKLLFTGMKSGYHTLLAGTSASFLASLITVVLLWLGAGYVLDQQITPGELFSFYTLIAYFSGPMTALLGASKSIQNARIAADRLFEIMDLALENGENPALVLGEEPLGDIRFEQVYFSYGSRVRVFAGLDVRISQGKMTAIVGDSGSGKTSLFSLLLGLYPIQEGRIMAGEYDIRHICSADLRRRIAVVPQQIQLFSGNVIDNIALGDPFPDVKRVLKLCRDTGIAEFIEKIPSGYDTPLGENGAMLSGGQKQRIALARALYREPEILLLDEATSSLDSASEQSILINLERFRQMGKTLVVIAHRLSTIIQADHIIVLQRGQVVQAGTHRELIQSEGAYAKMVAAQGLLV
jgi:ATP-binding cassette, subfamily C, bacteriocin exporter